MENSQIAKPVRYRAVKVRDMPTKDLLEAYVAEKDGTLLFWMIELNSAGLLSEGLAKILSIDVSQVNKIIEEAWENIDDLSFQFCLMHGQCNLPFQKVKVISNGLYNNKFFDIIPEAFVGLVLAFVKENKSLPNDVRIRAASALVGGTGENFQTSVLEDLTDNQKEKRAQTSIEKQKVYIIQCSVTKVFKVGVSNNPEKRLQTIQVGYPYPLELVLKYSAHNPRKTEREIHSALKEFKLNGEWFSPNGIHLARQKLNREL